MSKGHRPSRCPACCICEVCGEPVERPVRGATPRRCTACRVCEVEWCNAPSVNRNLCNAHYQQVVVQGREPSRVRGRDEFPCTRCGRAWFPTRLGRETRCEDCRVCAVEGCNTPTGGRRSGTTGYCGMHYTRLYRQQVDDPHAPVPLVCTWCDAPFTLPAHTRLGGRKGRGCLCPDCAELRAAGWVSRRRFNGARPPEIVRMLHEQDGKCLVCGSAERRLGVDHGHGTGKVRAILCINCNSALGLLGEDASRIRALAAYIERFS